VVIVLLNDVEVMMNDDDYYYHCVHSMRPNYPFLLNYGYLNVKCLNVMVFEYDSNFLDAVFVAPKCTLNEAVAHHLVFRL